VSIRAAELCAETLRAYGEYIGALQRLFVDHVKTGRMLSEVADTTAVVRDGHVLVQTARGNGIVAIPGGLIHHWLGMVFIPRVTLEEAISVSQDYANYKHIYEPILDTHVLEQNGDTFRVRLRLHKRSGLLSAVLDVWSVVRYEQTGNVVYSVSDSERITEVKHASEADEHRLPPGQDSGYLWQALFRASPNETPVCWWKSRTSASAEASHRFSAGSSSQLPGESAGAASKTLSMEFRAAVIGAHPTQAPTTNGARSRSLALEPPLGGIRLMGNRASVSGSARR
jgi:hypothetical protein